MNVPFGSFKPLEKELGSQLRAAFDRVLENSWYIGGKEDEMFEQAFAAYCSSNYCVGCGNGLDALMLALKALGITSAFNHEANFSPILSEQEAWLDAVNHAARVKIDEEGVEAAAYTVMAVAGAARPPEDEMDFILDRPFLFLITSRDNLPLFAGVVNNP